MKFVEKSATLWNKAEYLRFLTARYGAFRRGRGFRGKNGDYFERYYFNYKREEFHVVITGDEPNFASFDYSAFSRFFEKDEFVLGPDREAVIRFLDEVLDVATFSIVGDDGAEQYHLSAGFFVERIAPQLDTEFLDRALSRWEHDLLLTLSVLRDPSIALDTMLSIAFAKTLQAMRPSGTAAIADKFASDSHLDMVVRANMGEPVVCDGCGGNGRRFFHIRECPSCDGAGTLSIVE